MASGFKMLTRSKNLHIIAHGEKALFYNAFSGNAFIADKNLISFLQEFDRPISESDLFDHYDENELGPILQRLLKNKILVNTEQIEENRPYRVFSEDKIHSGGLVNKLRLTLTRQCNMRCDYCYVVYNKFAGMPEKMNWDIAQNALERFSELLNNNQQRSTFIRFFGGEPLLNWPVLKKCLDYIEDNFKGIVVQLLVNTNGTIYAEEIAEKLKTHRVALAISLDGDEKAHDRYRRKKTGGGSFQSIVHNIERYIEKGCIVGVEATLGDHNINALIPLIDIIAEMNNRYHARIPISFQHLNFCPEKHLDTLDVQSKVDRVMAALVYAREKEVDADNGLICFPLASLMGERPKGIFCRAMGGEINVEPNGDIFPCAALPLNMGHLSELHSVFSSDAYARLVHRVAGNIEACRGCEIEAYCGGGCAADAYMVNKNINIPSEECEFRKLFFRNVVEHLVLKNRSN